MSTFSRLYDLFENPRPVEATLATSDPLEPLYATQMTSAGLRMSNLCCFDALFFF